PALIRYAKRCGVTASLRGLMSGAATGLVANVGPDRIINMLNASRRELGETHLHYFSFGGVVQTARYANDTAQACAEQRAVAHSCQKEPPQSYVGQCRWSANGSRAPTLMIGLACLLAVGGRADLNPQFQLFVALDGGLLGAAAFFAPHQRQLSANFAVLLIAKAPRQHLAFVEAVSREHRRADNLTAAHYGIEGA